MLEAACSAPSPGERNRTVGRDSTPVNPMATVKSELWSVLRHSSTSFPMEQFAPRCAQRHRPFDDDQGERDMYTQPVPTSNAG